MTVKSVLQVDVDDQQFQRFQALFDRYQKQLEKTPSAWASVSKENAGTAKNFEKMAAALMAQQHISREAAESDKAQAKHLTLSERLWTSMAKSTKSVASNIVGATGALLKWTGLLGAVSGLLGAGGLWGIDRMAAGVSDRRRSSMGLGLSTGEQSAFRINFGRLVDTDSFLGWVNQMETDPTKAWSASALGMNLTGSTGADSVQMLKTLRARAQATPTNQLGLLPGQFGLSGVSVEDLRRLKTMSDKEFGGLVSGNARDIGALGLGGGTAEKWQNFTTQMERAGATIFKTFVVGLAPLAGPLEHLSSAFVKTLGSMMSKNGIIEEGINHLAKWVENFSVKVASDDFQKGIEKFTSSIGDLADVIHKLVHPIDSSSEWASDKMSDLMNWIFPSSGSVTASKDSYRSYLRGKDVLYGFPAGTSERVWQVESGSNLYPRNSSKGAIGAFQLMPDTAKQYGVDPRDPMQAASGGTKYLNDLKMQYRGDMNKALAAYNLGPSKLDKIINQHPSDWLKYTPKETQDAVRRESGVTVVIQNQTGGQATTSVSALAH